LIREDIEAVQKSVDDAVSMAEEKSWHHKHCTCCSHVMLASCQSNFACDLYQHFLKVADIWNVLNLAILAMKQFVKLKHRQIKFFIKSPNISFAKYNTHTVIDVIFVEQPN